MGPNPKDIFPNPNLPNICYIKNVVKNPNVIIGDYTYYFDENHPEKFEEHITNFYDFIGDKLIIGKFCSIAKGIEFVMNGANHRMSAISTYPFYVMGSGWGSALAPHTNELPLKGDTVIGSDVWIGQNVTIMPGVHIGDGAIIGTNSTVAKDIPPYAIAVGNPCIVKRYRYSQEEINKLEEIKWWDWDIEKINKYMDIINSNDVEKSLN